ncbi:MAG: ABC transporter six-transmembrane domain-containing protein [Planctomycetales bacterium]
MHSTATTRRTPGGSMFRDRTADRAPQPVNVAASVAVPAEPALREIFRAHRGRILFTYALFNIENLLRLAQPLVLGLAIDGLLKSSYWGLGTFVAQHLAHLLVGTFRKAYDTRAFTAIYSELATGLVVGQRGRQVEVSRVAARSALSREYVEFFEQYVPLLIRALYSIVGALVMLGVYDWTLIPFCTLLVVPAALLNVAYGRRMLQYSGGLHDQFENEVDAIGDGGAPRVRDHYDALARWRIRMSDAEATNFALMEVFVLAAIVGALVHFCTSDSPRPGEIFAVFRYVLMFIMGLDVVPRLVQQLSRLRDIGRRMRPPQSCQK